MQISLRSQMLAGIAAVGVTAVVVAPVVHPDTLPSMQRVTATFSLTQFVNPITAIGQVVQAAGANIFDQAPTPEYFFPLPSDTYPYDLFYQPSFVGIVPDVAARLGLGPLNAVVDNLSGYAFAGLTGVGALVGGVGAAAFGLPLATVEAVGALIAGDPEAALQILIDQVVTPLQAGVETALSAIGYVVDNVIINAQNVLTGFLPGAIANLSSLVIGVPTYLFAEAVEAVTAVFASVSTGDVEGAWNAAVNGLLGPDGTLGLIEKLTIGVGVVEEIEGQATIVVPSLRTVVNDALLTLAEPNVDGVGISNPPFDPTPTPRIAAEPAAALAPESDVTAEPLPVEAAALGGEDAGAAVGASADDDAADLAAALDAEAAEVEAAEAADAAEAAGSAGAVTNPETDPETDSGAASATDAGDAPSAAGGDTAGDEA